MKKYYYIHLCFGFYIITSRKLYDFLTGKLKCSGLVVMERK